MVNTSNKDDATIAVAGVNKLLMQWRGLTGVVPMGVKADATISIIARVIHQDTDPDMGEVQDLETSIGKKGPETPC